MGYVADVFADGRPAVGMHLVGQGAQQVAVVAIGLVQVALLEFLDDHLPLHLQAFRVEVQAQHAVGLQPECQFDVVCRERDVIVCDVVVRPRVVFPSGLLDGRVIVGDVHRAAEHQVLKQVGESRVVGVLVAGAHLI